MNKKVDKLINLCYNNTFIETLKGIHHGEKTQLCEQS